LLDHLSSKNPQKNLLKNGIQYQIAVSDSRKTAVKRPRQIVTVNAEALTNPGGQAKSDAYGRTPKLLQPQVRPSCKATPAYHHAPSGPHDEYPPMTLQNPNCTCSRPLRRSCQKIRAPMVLDGHLCSLLWLFPNQLFSQVIW
jgi:hypothetical protein